MKVLINSNNNFSDKTLPILLRSLYRAGLDPNDIIIIIGGYKDRYQRITAKEEIYQAPHNSYDFTALIAYLELDLPYSSCFYLHDTCEVGPNFGKLYNQFNESHGYKALKPPENMNIGAYTKAYLNTKKQEILKFKNTNYTPAGLQHAKHQAVVHEGMLLHNSIEYYCTKGEKKDPTTGIYGSNVERLIEYYDNPDIYKYKSNWYYKNHWEINL